MKIQGSISKKGKFSVIKFPILCAMLDVANDESIQPTARSWLESLIFAETSFKTKINVEHTNNQIILSCSQSLPLVSTIIARRRREASLTTRELANILGMKSHAALVRYENGKSEPSLTTLEKILVALDASLAIVI